MFETKTVPTLVGGFGSGAWQLGVGLRGELDADCMLIGSGARQLGLRDEQPSLWPFSEREMPLRRRVRTHEATLARARVTSVSHQTIMGPCGSSVRLGGRGRRGRGRG